MNTITVIEKEVSRIVEEARSFVVANLADYQAATEFSLNCKSLEKKIKADFKDSKEAAKAAHDKVCAQEKSHLQPLIEAQKIVDTRSMSWYRSYQDKLEEERGTREEAARKQSEEIRLNQAIQAEKAGDKQRSEALLAQPITVSVPKQEAPKIDGVSIVKLWDAEIIDANAIPREYLTPDILKIRQVARAMKDQTNIPGVRVFSVDSMRKRT